jgi:hypothetical protein
MSEPNTLTTNHTMGQITPSWYSEATLTTRRAQPESMSWSFEPLSLRVRHTKKAERFQTLKSSEPKTLTPRHHTKAAWWIQTQMSSEPYTLPSKVLAKKGEQKNRASKLYFEQGRTRTRKQEEGVEQKDRQPDRLETYQLSMTGST